MLLIKFEKNRIKKNLKKFKKREPDWSGDRSADRSERQKIKLLQYLRNVNF